LNTATRHEIKKKSHKTTHNTTSHSDEEIIKKHKKKLDICKNHLFRSNEIRKQRGDSKSKIT